MLKYILLTLSLTTSLAAQPAITATHLKTIDISAYTAEIVQYHAPSQTLVSTNSHWKTLDIFTLTDPLNPTLIAEDHDDEHPGDQGLPTTYEPTSVAIHPSRPIVIVTVLSQDYGLPGRVLAFDLTPQNRGTILLNQTVGQHPDSIAITPDGRYAIIANEAESLTTTDASIHLIDITNLTTTRRAYDPPLPAFDLPGLAKHLRKPLGIIEPEFVAVDPLSRFAAITIQEQSSLVLVDLQSKPAIALATPLSLNAGPDGLDILHNIPNPHNPSQLGALIAAAEEGTFDKLGNLGGQSFELIWVDPNNLTADPIFLAHHDIRPDVSKKKSNKRREPEAIKLARLGSYIIGVLAVERGDCILVYNFTDPTSPQFIKKVDVGKRPEGLTLIKHTDPNTNKQHIIAVTGDEGKYGPGTISFVKISLQ
ncbi:hypothetical protein KS4_17810 [Poriferisphaera corsica]|uniref:Alkaline phosphatase n=1 Tax=Poriferisphaera corsica TaxID=2528020 RepID=A0A517YU07_9BACT|nr:hypothetical protein [Poriferisphaera corsica]QDU33725.1 hypothetical protein KS4_17810 [Poriferisphaera corsica]